MFIRPINNTRDGFNFVKRIKTSGSTEKLIDLFNRLSSLFDRYRIYSKYPVKSVCQRIRYTPNEALIFHQFCQTYCPDIHIRDIDPKYYGSLERRKNGRNWRIETVLERFQKKVYGDKSGYLKKFRSRLPEPKGWKALNGKVRLTLIYIRFVLLSHPSSHDQVEGC